MSFWSSGQARALPTPQIPLISWRMQWCWLSTICTLLEEALCASCVRLGFQESRHCSEDASPPVEEELKPRWRRRPVKDPPSPPHIPATESLLTHFWVLLTPPHKHLCSTSPRLHWFRLGVGWGVGGRNPSFPHSLRIRPSIALKNKAELESLDSNPNSGDWGCSSVVEHLSSKHKVHP
jgi:hypothetical protein